MQRRSTTLASLKFISSLYNTTVHSPRLWNTDHSLTVSSNMKQASILVLALVVVSSRAVERKRVLRAPIHSPADSNLDEFKSMFDAEGAAAEAMEAFGRYVVVCLQELRKAEGTIPRINSMYTVPNGLQLY